MYDPEGESNSNGSNGLKTKVLEIRAAAGERSSQARERAQQELEEQRERIAAGLAEAADSLKRHAETTQLQQETERLMAQRMEATAGYLQSHRTDQLAHDLGGFIRQHPLRWALVALITGFLIARLIR